MPLSNPITDSEVDPMIKNSPEYFSHIKKMYHLRGDDLHHYELMGDHAIWPFSPIERIAFDVLKIEGVRFHVEYPAEGYILDFAICGHKVGIELDGKKWHDPERDAIRDAKLAAEGWMIFRVPGVYCYRTISNRPLKSEDDAGIHAFAQSLLRVMEGNSEMALSQASVRPVTIDDDEDDPSCRDVLSRFVSPACADGFDAFVEYMDVLATVREIGRKSKPQPVYGLRPIQDIAQEWLAEIHRQRAL